MEHGVKTKNMFTPCPMPRAPCQLQADELLFAILYGNSMD